MHSRHVDSLLRVRVDPLPELPHIPASLPLPFDPPLPVEAGNDSIIDLTEVPGLTSAIHGVAITAVEPTTGQGRIIYASENLLALLGYEPHEVLGKSPGMLYSPGTPDDQIDAVAQVVEQGFQAVLTMYLAHRDGSAVVARVGFIKLPAMVSDWPYYLTIFRNPNEAVSLKSVLGGLGSVIDGIVGGDKVMASLGHIASVVEQQIIGARCFIALADPSGRLDAVVTSTIDFDVVQAAIDAVDYINLTESGAAGAQRYLRVSDLDEALQNDLRHHGVDALWLVPVLGAHAMRRGMLVIGHMARVTPTEGEQIVLDHVARLIALALDHGLTEAQIAHQSFHDHLTKLPNRALITDRLAQAIARLGRDKARLAVLLVDIDRFKLINDANGSDIGDAILREVAGRLRQVVKPGDTVGRMNGDQFMLVCVAVESEEDIHDMADRVTKAMDRPFDVGPDRRRIRLSASIGVVVVDEPHRVPNMIISEAELARPKPGSGIGAGSRYGIYKHSGKSIMLSAAEQLEIEQSLPLAIARKELMLYYQPLVDTSTGIMVGAEALMRWDRPGRGLYPPAEFIKIAERTGLIIELGNWAIEDACRHFHHWPVRADGERPVISVNLSARQLMDPGLISTIESATERYEIPPNGLCFELTETAQVENPELAREMIQKIQAMGFKLSIDDYGTGHANLQQLSELKSADSVKIDRSFVSRVQNSSEDRALVHTTATMAHEFGMTIVAEGVETYEQFTDVGELGCDLAQGYYLSPPVPLDQAIDLWVQGQLILLP